MLIVNFNKLITSLFLKTLVTIHLKHRLSTKCSNIESTNIPEDCTDRATNQNPGLPDTACNIISSVCHSFCERNWYCYIKWQKGKYHLPSKIHFMTAWWLIIVIVDTNKNIRLKQTDLRRHFLALYLSLNFCFKLKLLDWSFIIAILQLSRQ